MFRHSSDIENFCQNSQLKFRPGAIASCSAFFHEARKLVEQLKFFSSISVQTSPSLDGEAGSNLTTQRIGEVKNKSPHGMQATFSTLHEICVFSELTQNDIFHKKSEVDESSSGNKKRFILLTSPSGFLLTCISSNSFLPCHLSFSFVQ